MEATCPGMMAGPRGTKHATRLLPLLLLVALPAMAQAQFNYTINGDTITITGYTGSGGDVVIPETIGGLPVTTIGDCALEGCTSLTDITMPDSVTSIIRFAFAGCSSLTSITIPDSVISIESSAFAFCRSLTSVYFGGDAPSLGEKVFYDAYATIYYLEGSLGWGPYFGGRPTVSIVPDSDGDDVADGEDSCPLSDLRATVVIAGRDSGVPNTLFPDGATIADPVGIIAVAARNHGGFVNGIAEYLDELKEAGVITGAQKGAIQSCAAKAKIP